MEKLFKWTGIIFPIFTLLIVIQVLDLPIATAVILVPLYIILCGYVRYKKLEYLKEKEKQDFK